MANALAHFILETHSSSDIMESIATAGTSDMVQVEHDLEFDTFMVSHSRSCDHVQPALCHLWAGAHLALEVKLRRTCVREERARAPVCCTSREFSYDVSSTYRWYVTHSHHSQLNWLCLHWSHTGATQRKEVEYNLYYIHQVLMKK